MHVSYTRAPPNREPRTKLNDPYFHFKAINASNQGEFNYRQDYNLKYFVGSTLEEANQTRDEKLSFKHYDVSIISQTSLLFSNLFIYRIDRLFYLNYLLQRWKGFSFPLKYVE